MPEMILMPVIPASGTPLDVQAVSGKPVDGAQFQQLLGQFLKDLSMAEAEVDISVPALIKSFNGDGVLPEYPAEILQQLKLVLPILQQANPPETGSLENLQEMPVLGKEIEAISMVEVNSGESKALSEDKQDIPMPDLNLAIEYLASVLPIGEKPLQANEPLPKENILSRGFEATSTEPVLPVSMLDTYVSAVSAEKAAEQSDNAVPFQFYAGQRFEQSLEQSVLGTSKPFTEQLLNSHAAEMVKTKEVEVLAQAPVIELSAGETATLFKLNPLQAESGVLPKLQAVPVPLQTAEGQAISLELLPIRPLLTKNRLDNGGLRINMETEKAPKYQMYSAPIIQPMVSVKPLNEPGIQPEMQDSLTPFPPIVATELGGDQTSEFLSGFSGEQLPADGGILGEAAMETMAFGTVLTREIGEPVMSQTAVKQAGDTFPVSKETVFSQIVEKAKVMNSAGHSEMELDLKPDHLGKIQLRVSLENHLISAKFVAESEQVKAIIETNLVDLKRMLQENGVQVQNLVVTTGQSSNDQQLNENPFSQNRQQAQKNGKWAMVGDEAEMVGNETRTTSASVIDLIA